MTTMDTIAGRVEQMDAQPSPLPAEVRDIFAREQADLAAAGMPDGIAPAGSVLPDADLLDLHGNPTTLSAATAGRPSVVVFYRGAWCPYCNVALATYQSELLPALTARGIGLVAVSPQAPDGSLSMQQKHDLTFTVVSDPGNALARALGVLTGPTGEGRAAQLQLGLDLTAVNADHTTGLPMPTALILGPDLVVRWIDVHPDYSTRSEPEQILTALDQAVF
jgi:peroxiredoxin